MVQNRGLAVSSGSMHADKMCSLLLAQPTGAITDCLAGKEETVRHGDEKLKKLNQTLSARQTAFWK